MHSTGIPVDAEQLSGQQLFGGLGRDSLERIAQGGWYVDFPRGTRVLGRGDTLDGLYTVSEGRLKLYMLSCNGDERVLRILDHGDSFGEAIMFNRIPSPVFVETLCHTRLAFFPRDVISAALAEDHAFTHAMLRGMSALMRELIQDLETCCLQTAQQRTVNYLMREAEKGPPPHVEIQLRAPKAVVASTLNISAETFSRELHRLQDAGLIEINRRTIYLRDRVGLLDITERVREPAEA